MRINNRQLRRLIREELRRSLSEYRRDKTVGPHRELKYARSQMAGEMMDTRSRKGRQRALHKATRQKAKSDIESQLSDMGPLDIAMITDLIPAEDRAAWDEMSGEAASTGPRGEIEHVRSQRDAYLLGLGWDVSYGDKHVDDIDKLLDLSNAFLDGFDQAYDAQYEEEGMEVHGGASSGFPVTPEEQQEEFDRLVIQGSDYKELMASGNYPDVETIGTEAAEIYLKRQYDWLEDTPQEEISRS